MIRPWNCQPVVVDKLVMSDVVTLAAASGTTNVFFYDPLHNWQVIDVRFLPTAPYIASQAVTVNVGVVGTTNAFVAANSLGTAAVAVGQAVVLSPTKTDTIVNAGQMLNASWVQNATQTGTGKFWVRLRPQYAKYESNKRPTAAQNAV